MPFNISAFGWHATIWVNWGWLAVLVAAAAGAVAVVKLLVSSVGR
jgi:hypothetical protein